MMNRGYETWKKIKYYARAIVVRLIVAFFGAATQNRELKFYGGSVDAAGRVNAL